MKNNKTNNTNMTKKPVKPLRISIYSYELGFNSDFDITFEVNKRSAVREVAKYLIGLGYVSMEYIEYLDRVYVCKNANVIGTLGRVPLTVIGLTRLMGYAA